MTGVGSTGSDRLIAPRRKMLACRNVADVTWLRSYPNIDLDRSLSCKLLSRDIGLNTLWEKLTDTAKRRSDLRLSFGDGPDRPFAQHRAEAQAARVDRTYHMSGR
jgi:hypothetical protein